MRARHLHGRLLRGRTWGRRAARTNALVCLVTAALAAVGLVAVSPQATAAVAPVAGTTARASLFSDFGFAGAARDLAPGAYDLTLGQGAPVATGAASSLQVPAGLRVLLCTATMSCSVYGAGSYATLTPNDSATFVVVAYTTGGAPAGLPTGGSFYVDFAGGGAALTLSSGASLDLYREASPVGNDKVSSVSVIDGNVSVLCTDSIAPVSPAPVGTCWTYGAGSSDVTAVANDQASFVAVVPGAATNVTVFPHPALAGTPASYGPGVYDLGEGAVGVRNASSVIVPAGLALWLCDGRPGVCRWYPSGTYAALTPDDAATTAVVVRLDTRQLPLGATLYQHPGQGGASLGLASGGQADLNGTALAATLSSANVAAGHVLVACPALPTGPGGTLGSCFQQQPGQANVPAGTDDTAQLVAVGPSTTASGATPAPAVKPLPAAAESGAGPKVTLYRDDLSGGSVSLPAGIYDATRGELGAVGNDALSSLVVPAGLTVWLCPDGVVGADVGVCRVAGPGTYGYSSALMAGINDLTSTVVVDGGNGRAGDEGAIAWRDNGFAGPAETFPGGGGYDVGANGYFGTVGNDAISSLRVREGMRAFACQNGIAHSAVQPARCYVFGAGDYPTMPTGFSDIVSYLAVYSNVGSDPSRVGRWTPTTDIGIGVRAGTVLPSGKVLVWETGGSQLLDPATSTTSGDAAQPAGQDLFCSTHVLLPNGDVVAAASGGGGNPVKLTAAYSAKTNTWTAAPQMNQARYYPSLAQLGNGSLFVAGGNDVFGLTTGVQNAPITTPEVFENGAWRSLTNARIPFSGLRGTTNDSAFWPWLTQTANGDVLYAGPDTSMHLITTAGAGSLRTVGTRDSIVRTYGSFAQYAPGKMLVAGGANSVSSAEVVDFSSGTPAVSQTGSLGTGRRQANLTVLADGTVLETGGNFNGAEQIDHDAMVLSAERWNPATGTWTTLAPMARSRQYHSIALLLPDARVLVAGESQPPFRDTTVQYFSPPYLFNADGTAATRPVVATAPAGVGYGTRFTVGVTGGPVQALNLVKLGSVTHSTNFTQRLLPLTFTASGGTLTVSAPTNRNLAPAGQYMLFAVNPAGVPSVAAIVTLA